ncbi:DUF4387 domain-containing protein [Brevundimonas goettingensis]|uniref:DUF4387 domain-containing protein n=1 Tax=Brevundimonas goettingensis TaxID=2774190 RepID=A0A975C2M5_9CAUL|nr:DUF4387 domain-containing protein [Brevundimonas goettingensis]QTC91934.1 DUF4387 domain-containing protein [Brevundimonas goettingensis]
MPKVKEVCRHVRSKVAGPFWVTIDLMFDSQENYDRYSQSPTLSAASIGEIYDVDPATVQHYPVPALQVLKISYPRRGSQGGVEERDLHSGQQYTYLIDKEL